MLITTTPNIEGKRITRYYGLVAGEAILGANVFKDMFAGIRDLVGGRSGTYEKELQRARDIALQGTRGTCAGTRSQRRGWRGPRLRGSRREERHAHGFSERHRGRRGIDRPWVTVHTGRVPASQQHGHDAAAGERRQGA